MSKIQTNRAMRNDLTARDWSRIVDCFQWLAWSTSAGAIALIPTFAAIVTAVAALAAAWLLNELKWGKPKFDPGESSKFDQTVRRRA